MTFRTSTVARRPALTSAQRVILLLGVPVVLMLAAWSGYGIVASIGHSSYSVTSSAPVSGGRLTMTAGDGGDGVTVQGGAATGSVRLAGTVSYDLVRPDVHPALSTSRGPDGTSVGFSCPADNCQLDASASVPSATAVSVTGDGGPLSVSGIMAPVTASTGGGDLTLNAVTGPLDLTTAGGSVEGTALAAPDVTVNTDPGFSDGGGNVDLMLTTVPKDLQVNSGGGNVTIQLPPGSGYRLRLDGGCGNGPREQSAVPSSAGSVAGSWCPDVSSAVPDDPSSPNVIVVSSAGGQITIT